MITSLLKIAAKLDSKGEFQKSDRLLKKAYSMISRYDARRIAINLTKYIRQHFSDIVEDAWATGSVAYESQNVINTTSTKDIDIIVRIRGRWNRIPIEQRLDLLHHLYLANIYGVGLDIFLTDDSGKLAYVNSADLDDRQIWHRESDDIIDIKNNDDDYPVIKNLTPWPHIAAPRQYMPIGWYLWGIRDRDDTPEKVYWRHVRKPKELASIDEDIEWSKSTVGGLKDNLTYMGRDADSYLRDLRKDFEKAGRIHKLSPEEIERRWGRMMHRVS